jgi:hypothetical protein
MIKKLLLCVFLLAAVPLWSQVSVIARVDKTNLTQDDELTLTVEVSGPGNISAPQLPSLPAFNVYSRQTTQASVNGRSTYRFSYTMVPRVIGNATIGEVTVTSQGKTYKTQPIEIHIYRSGTAGKQANPASSAATANPTQTNYDSSFAPPVTHSNASLPPLEKELINQAYKKGSHEAFFMVSAVDNYRPYVNQPITLAVRFYYASQFEEGHYNKPSVSNFFVEEKGSVEGTQQIGGQLFRYTEMRYLLIPAAPGEAVITAANATFITGSSPFALFGNFFGFSGGMGEQQMVESSPVKLNVRPLPSAGKPASFYGAVGSKFTLTAKAEPAKVEAGETVAWTVTVQGIGNLKTSDDLPLPAPVGFEAYPAASVFGTLPNYSSRSYKIFKTVLVPASSGTYELPAVAWSYFDPSDATYKTLYSPTVPLTVTPATKTNRQVDFGAITDTGKGVQRLEQDITYLKSTPAPKPSVLVTLSTWQALNWVILVLLGVCVFIASVGRKSWAKKQSFAQAKSTLQKAKTYEDISDAVATYFAQKLHITTGSLPLKEILHRLEQRGCTPAETEQFARLWQTWEAARFAPAANGETGVEQQAQKALDYLKLLEEKRK